MTFSLTTSNDTSKEIILVDTASQINITPRLDSLTNIEDCGENFFITANGDKIPYYKKGIHKILGETFYHPDVPFTIASFHQLQKLFDTHFIRQLNRFEFYQYGTRELLYFAKSETEESRGLYPLQEEIQQSQMNFEPEKVKAVYSVVSSHSKSKETLFGLHKKWLHAHLESVEKGIKDGQLDVEYDEADREMVRNCTTCTLTKDGNLRNRTRLKESGQNKITLPYQIKPIQVKLCADIVYLLDHLYLLMVAKPINFALCLKINNRSAEQLVDKIGYLVKDFKSLPGIESIRALRFDRETALGKIKHELTSTYEIMIEQAAPGEHERGVEIVVRTLRNKVRSVLLKYPLPITKETVRLAFEHCVAVYNLVPGKGAGKFLAYNWAYNTDKAFVPLEFGTFVIVKHPTRSKIQSPNQVGVVVGVELETGYIKVKLKGINQPVVRSYFTILNNQEGLELYRTTLPNIKDQDQPIKFDAEVKYLEEDKFRDLIQAGETIMDILEEGEDEEEEIEAGENIKTLSETTNEILRDTVPKTQKGKDVTLLEHQVLTRTGRVATKYIGAMVQMKPTHVMLLSISDMAEKAKQQTDAGFRASVVLEVFKLWKEFNAYEPVVIPPQQEIAYIKGKLFTIEKLNSTGEFQRYKSRLVARGDQRNEDFSVLDTFSPTIAFATFMIALNLILFFDLAWMIVDVENAYLNATLGKGIYMKLDHNVVDIMMEIDPGVREFIRSDGTMVVEIKKAIYGLQESALCWYKLLKSTLKQMGFSPCNYDHSLFHRYVDGKIQLITCFVDDCLIGAQPQHVENIKREFASHFQIKSSDISPKVFDYIGIRVEYNPQDHSFKLSQPGFIDKITAEMDFESNLPCVDGLYNESTGGLLKNPTKFRSLLMSLKFLERTRPDIKVVVQFLASKMQEPRESDWQNLLKAVAYVKGTKHFSLRVKPDSLQVRASADSSHAPYKNGKSVAGIFVTLGSQNAPVISKSTVIKRICTSSSTAELEAAVLAITEALWVRNLLEDIGITQGPLYVEQDNTSTMSILQKGPSSESRLKWINLKSLWITEYIQEGTIILEKIASEDMITDPLTKPVRGGIFEKWRARILNVLRRN